MPLYRALLQTLGALVLLATALACRTSTSTSGSAATGTVNISGNVSYLRVPLAKNASGVPTGLADATVAGNLTSLPARNTSVRIYQQIEQTQADGTKQLTWILASTGFTDVSGNYTLAVPKDRLTMVEILSTFSAGGNLAHLVAEPNGINSTTPALNRLNYGLRKAMDGSAPAGNNAPSSLLSVNTTVNFTVGLNDEWWLVDPDYNLTTNLAPGVASARLETSEAGRTPGAGTGSRVLGIGDTINSFVAVYGNATPGATLHLHYWPGRSEPQGSYIYYGPYDPTHYPQAYDYSISRYVFFGSLRGGTANDDAWDEGVILPLLGRNQLFATNIGRTFDVSMNRLLPISTALTDLSPDLARIEGLPDAMAANVLKSPYLADTQGTALAAPVRDVRDLSGLSLTQKTPFSAPSLRAFSWEIVLKANSLPSPGTSVDWATINPLAAARFFKAPAGFTNGSIDLEPLNIYSQLARLSEGRNASTEPVDLATVFTDAVLTPLAAPFGLPWPRPVTGPYAAFITNWGTDPISPFPLVPLSMTKASLINGVYPNVSPGEVVYSGFSLSADKRCVLSVAISPALAAGTQLDVDLSRMSRTFSFSGAGGSSEVIVIPVSVTGPFYHPVRFRLKSPAALQPDVAVTLTLTPAP